MTEKRLERNNKERLKNNILIKIEFLDTEGIVKWYGISNKVVFWDDKIEYDRILWCWCSNNYWRFEYDPPIK